MRRARVLTVLVLVFVGLLCFFRHQIRILGRTILTFSSFQPYLEQHPETLYRLSASPTSLESQKIVPAIIHRIILQERHNPALSENNTTTSRCHALHPNWTHVVWRDSTASEFIQQHYPSIWPHYKAYRQTIQRANVLRYAVLHRFGGIYLDWDVECLRPLDELRHLPWLTPAAYPVGVNNAFFLSQPGHPFLDHVLAGVVESDRSWGFPYVENMLSTGCMFLSNMWMSYMRSRPDGPRQVEEPLYVLADERGRLEQHMLRGAVTTPLFRHDGASSWHEWDAAVIVLIGEHYRTCLLLLAVLTMIVPVMTWAYSSHHSRRPIEKWKHQGDKRLKMWYQV